MTGDTTAPKLLSYELSTYNINLSNGDALIDVSARISDDLSGVFDGTYASGMGGSPSQARWRSPSGEQFLDAGLFNSPSSGTYLDGIYRDQTTLSKFSEHGTWTLDYVLVVDEAGNSKSFNTAELNSLGIRTTFEVAASSNADTTAPKLHSYELSTYNINLSNGDALIDVSARISDDISGVFDGIYASGMGGSPSQARWRSPSGKQFLDAGLFNSPSSGTYLDGIYRDQTTLSKFSEHGTWTLDYVLVVDEAGNSKSFNTSELNSLGIRTTLEVSDGSKTSPEVANANNQNPSSSKAGDVVINVIGDGNNIGDININFGDGVVNTGEWTGNVFFNLPSTASIADITKQWFGSTNTSETKAQTLDVNSDPQLLDVATRTWSKKVKVNKVVQASNNGDTIRAEAPEKFVPAIGSVLNGGQSRDIVEGRIGWDIIDGGDGSDFIHGGNGRDVITGGAGGDELWGDFGLNTFKSEKDGQKDLVVIKSDHYVYNWLNNSYTNNPNGERTDFIEGLDSWDRIRVTGGYKQDLRFAENISHMGQTGIAIYLKDSLEALYTGNDLSLDQIKNMTDGDGSDAAITNSVHQYGLDWL